MAKDRNLLPSEWLVKTLGEIVTIQSGDSPANHELLESGTYQYIKVEDLNFSDKYQERSRNYVNNARSLVPPNSIVFPKRGAAIMVNKVRLSKESIAMDSNMMAITPKNEGDAEFIYYSILFENLSKIADSSTIPQINNKHILPYEIFYPPKIERENIAKTLCTWDEALKLQTRKLQQLRKRKDGIAQGLLSQQKRMPGFSGDARLAKAGSIFLPVSKRGHEQEELLSVTQDQGVLPRSMLEGRVVMPEGTTAGYKLVESGNFVISLRSFQGGLEYSEYRGLVSPAYTVLESTPQVVPDFYKHYFKSADFVKRLASAVIGIRDGKQISFKDFSIINIPHPEPDEQRAIAEVLNTAAEEIRLEEDKLAALREQKRGLLHQLLTGQLRLS